MDFKKLKYHFSLFITPLTGCFMSDNETIPLTNFMNVPYDIPANGVILVSLL